MINFIIPGTPIAKGRPRFARRGNFVSTYSPQKTVSYENLVKVYAAQAMEGMEPMIGAVRVVITFHVTPPASWSQKKQASALNGGIYPTLKPDLDNCIKGIFDACNEIVWKDDKQVTDLMVTKRYAVKPMAEVRAQLI
jgi:Holliday junction resolvase RusA-like endonuclease